jgi:glycosyltransferase involved in cell wall biosynthesis
MNVCIVAHFAYPALVGDAIGHIGGVEHQTTLLARWLVERGHQVNLITWDEGQPDHCVIDGVRVLKLCKQKDGVPGMRFFYPRWTSLNAALRRAGADVYYQNCGEYITGQVALWCRWQHRKFVYSVAAEADCDVHLPLLTTWRERYLYRWGIRLADTVLVQTRVQQQMLHNGFGRDAQIIPMPCVGPTDSDFVHRELSARAQNRILWVGRLCLEKRPDRFLDLAIGTPDLQFDLVGPSTDSSYCRDILERARHIPNVVVHGRATQSQLAEFYQKAACLCCTSDNEGFPNVFLEAWSHGLPIVSTLDPDGVISKWQLGSVASDTTTLTSSIRHLLSSESEWHETSQRARRYYCDNHAADGVMPKFEQTFLNLLAIGENAKLTN